MSSATPPTLPDPAHSQAVLIGTSMGRREHDSQAEQGLRELRKMLCDKRIWGLSKENCHLLLDMDTADDVVDRCLSAAARVGQGGSLLLYFIGHSEKDAEGTLHLGVDRTTPNATLPMTRVNQLIHEHPSLTVTVILDCSYAGAASPANASPHVVLLGATDADTLSAVHPDQQYTTFTGELLQLLRRGTPAGPQLLSASDIFAWLSLRPALAKTHRQFSSTATRRPSSATSHPQANHHNPSPGRYTPAATATGHPPPTCCDATP